MRELDNAKAAYDADDRAEAFKILNEHMHSPGVGINALKDCNQFWFERKEFEWELAVARLIEAKFGPDHGVFFIMRALRALGRNAEAEVIYDNAPANVKQDEGVMSIWASLPMGQHDWAAALPRWIMMMERNPAEPKYRFQAVSNLRSVGKADEADDLLTESLELMPNEPSLQSLKRK